MFRNKLLLRVASPFSLSTSFCDLQLTVSHPYPFPLTLSLKLQSLCWELSRKWRIACLSEVDATKIHVVYQRSQSESAAEAVKELSENLPISDVEVEEQVHSSSLITKAIECGLRSALLNIGWRCLGDGLIIHSTFICSEEKASHYALQMTIQANSDDSFLIIVSPDVVRFSRHKVVDLVGSKMEHRFQSSLEVSVNNYNVLTSCSVLPSFLKGHVIGLCRSLPAGEDLQQYEQLWSFKHGLVLREDYFFMNVQFTDEGHGDKQWFPSAFVLQGSGLMPVPQTIRASKATFALDYFMVTVEAWDFFDGGLLKIMGACRLGIGLDRPVWAKATDNAPIHVIIENSQPNLHANINCLSSSLKNLLSSHDFRTPKPASRLIFCDQDPEDIKIQETGISAGMSILDDACTGIQEAGSINITTKFRPLFMERKPVRSKLSGDGDLVSKRVDKVAEMPFPLLQVTTSERMKLLNGESLPKSVPEDDVIDENNEAPEAVARHDNVAILKDIGNMKMNPKMSRTKGNKQVSLENGPIEVLTGSTKEPPMAVLGEMPSDKHEAEPNMRKKRPKQQPDPDKVTAKVTDFHARGLLGSLTVPELKGFLSTKKAKVGGKKEELILRVTSLLS